MRLSFIENRFVLQDVVNLGNLVEDVRDRPWTCIDKKTFSTSNLKAAARFRSAADSKAEYIFKKLMLRTLPIPSGGPLSPTHLPLFDFQRERGVPHILRTSKTYLAHQPGLGKSAQAISAVSTKLGLCDIICPSFLKTTWAREITKWFIGDFPSIVIIQDTERRFKVDWGADFIICSDSMLEKEWVRDGFLKRRSRYRFIDEGHRFKTPNANRTVALFGGSNGKIKSRGLIYDCEHVSFLSGTPLLNRPIELWPILFGAAPELIDFMPYQDFGFRYGGATMDNRGRWRFIGSANEEELNQKIMGRFMQRIRKRDVLKDLPEKVREVILIDQDNRSHEVKEMDTLCARKVKLDSLKSLGDYAKVRHANGLAKVNWTSLFITSLLVNDRDEQIILFAHHRDVVELLAKELKIFGPRVINGGVSDEERTAIEDAFQSGECRLIIGNISAMNLGLTLTAATRVVFIEYDWTPSANEQAEDRANRIGSKWSVFCQYLVFPNSIDELILNAVMFKEQKIARVMQ